MAGSLFSQSYPQKRTTPYTCCPRLVHRIPRKRPARCHRHAICHALHGRILPAQYLSNICPTRMDTGPGGVARGVPTQLSTETVGNHTVPLPVENRTTVQVPASNHSSAARLPASKKAAFRENPHQTGQRDGSGESSDRVIHRICAEPESHFCPIFMQPGRMTDRSSAAPGTLRNIWATRWKGASEASLHRLFRALSHTYPPNL